jgi:hypothetical protein
LSHKTLSDTVPCYRILLIIFQRRSVTKLAKESISCFIFGEQSLALNKTIATISCRQRQDKLETNEISLLASLLRVTIYELISVVT